MVDLTLDDVARPLGPFGALQLHQLQRRQNGGERIAQLVTQHRKEFVLRAVGALRGFAQALDLLARSSGLTPGPESSIATVSS